MQRLHDTRGGKRVMSKWPSQIHNCLYLPGVLHSAVALASTKSGSSYAAWRELPRTLLRDTLKAVTCSLRDFAIWKKEH